MKELLKTGLFVVLCTIFLTTAISLVNAKGELATAVEIEGGGGGGCYDTDIVTTYSYTDRNWVQEISISGIQWGGGFHTVKEEYEYDAVGNLKFLTDSETNPIVNKKTSFTYDNLNRLMGAQGVNQGQQDYWSRNGRYFDTLDFQYDMVGNIKKNYELEYCYMQNNNVVCGNSITNVDNNRLKKVRPAGSAFGSALETSYDYDPYGNLQTETSWQEIPVGDIDFNDGKVKAVGFEDLPIGTPLRILFYHNQNTLFPTAESAWWTTTVSQYRGGKRPYWDGATYTQGADIISQNLGGGSVIAADFYNDNLYGGYPFIKQYFRAYKEKTTTYCWDFANRMTKWYDNDGNCMAFGYDHAGNRIKKTELSSDRPGKWVSFDGDDDDIAINDANKLDLTTQLTLEAWVKLTAPPDPIHCEGIISKANGWNNGAYEIIACQNSNKWRPTFRFSTSENSNYNFYGGSPALELNTWYHVAVTLDTSNNARLYVNGVQSGNQQDMGAHPIASTGQLAIGTRGSHLPSTGLSHITGLIDEARIWNVVRSAADIQNSMNTEITSPPGSLVGYWKLNDGTGTTATDSSANPVNGVLTTEDMWAPRAKTTYYVTQGNNVIYETFEDTFFACPTSC
ncbi:MAG: LamG domain-containing protein [Nanoarchaeota archaeon]